MRVVETGRGVLSPNRPAAVPTNGAARFTCQHIVQRSLPDPRHLPRVACGVRLQQDAVLPIIYRRFKEYSFMLMAYKNILLTLWEDRLYFLWIRIFV